LFHHSDFLVILLPSCVFQDYIDCTEFRLSSTYYIYYVSLWSQQWSI